MVRVNLLLVAACSLSQSRVLLAWHVCLQEKEAERIRTPSVKDHGSSEKK